MSELPNYNPVPPRSTKPTSGSAIASLIFSILGMIGVLPFIGSIVGLILGYNAQKEIENSMGTLDGEGLAKVGIVLGWVGIAMLVLVLCLVMLGLITIPGIALCAGMFDTYRW
ncbi:MAG: DUF4190 domain-containing protein [Anaerolineae bacterium]|nr:DUF4190 domain-containing protein [Anaerolineae bacterium]